RDLSTINTLLNCWHCPPPKPIGHEVGLDGLVRDRLECLPRGSPARERARRMANITLSLAVGPYDQVRDLLDGTVVPEGIDLVALRLTPEEIFYRFTRFREWDVSEMSFGKYISMVSQGDDSLVAIPVFPSRVFRHSGLYVRADAGIADAAQLAGKRV